MQVSDHQLVLTKLRFGRSSAAFMIARAASKLEHWSPKIDTFARWYEDSIEELTAEL